MMNLGMVARVYPKAWRADIRDVTNSEIQLQRALVIGAMLPPEHRPADNVESFVLYGFNGGRRNDAWCIPIHHTHLTNDEREANSFFMRLLGVSVRIGKAGDDVVYEVSGGNAIVRVNVSTGNVLVQGADGSVKIEMEAGGKITMACKTGQTVEVHDGTGPAVALTKATDHNNLVTVSLIPHTHTTAFGPTGVMSPVPATITGTSVLKAK